MEVTQPKKVHWRVREVAHGLLGNTFIRFLARQCGNSSAAAFDTRLTAVEKKVKDVHKRVEDEATAAKRKAGKATPTP
jgi:hypothetical protein